MTGSQRAVQSEESQMLQTAESKRWHVVLPCGDAAMLNIAGRPENSFYQETGM